MVLELVTGGELFKRLHEMYSAEKMYDEYQAVAIFTPLILALAYMHDQGIAHRGGPYCHRPDLVLPRPVAAHMPADVDNRFVDSILSLSVLSFYLDDVTF